MDDRGDAPVVVHHHDVAADDDISVAPRRSWQIPRQVARYRVRPLLKTAIQTFTLTKPSFLVRGELVLLPEASRRVVLMLLVPISRGFSTRLAVLVVSLPAFLGKSYGTG
jgi:hypothetical protein